jgi:hypothetical protein
MYGKTTCLAALTSVDPILNGEEFYNIYGPNFQENMDGSEERVAKIIHSRKKDIISKMAGLKRHWSCLEKAIMVRRFIGAGVVSIGSLSVMNNEKTGTFGYYYRPPYEFHAWVELKQEPRYVIDFGLPGVIEKGLITKDEYGYILKDMEPVILCGPVPEWLSYRPYEYISLVQENELAAKFSIDIN